MPRCSVIIPVYNTAAVTQGCLSALLADPPQVSTEIIVVDDGSADRTPAMLDEHAHAIRVVRLEENGGFAVACNAGAATAEGEHLVFLNNDTIPQTGWLDALVADALEYQATVVGARLLFPNGTVQHAGVTICTDGNPRHLYAGFPADHHAVTRSRPFQAVTAACMLVRREAFEAVGGFDTNYRNGLEDTDLCLRLGERGHGVRFCHRSVLLHLESVSRGRRSKEIDHNARVFRARWGGRVRSDELDFYVADGLLQLHYDDVYPLGIDVAPELAGVNVDQRAESSAANARAGHVLDLLKETVRLSTHIAERELVGTWTPVPKDTPPPVTARGIESAIHELQTEVARRSNGFQASSYLGYRSLVLDVRAAVEQVTPPGANLLVVSRGDDELVDFDDRTAAHFPQTSDGGYLGYYPVDSPAAIDHLEELRREGAEFLVVPDTAAWWLEHYRSFADHVRAQSSEALAAGSCQIYRLAPSDED